MILCHRKVSDLKGAVDKTAHTRRTHDKPITIFIQQMEVNARLVEMTIGPCNLVETGEILVPLDILSKNG